MLKIKNVSHYYGSHMVLKNVTFKGYPGEILGLVAPNGAGKTTLLHIIMNFIQPSEGQVEWHNNTGLFDYQSEKSTVAMHRIIGYLPEIDDLYTELSGRDHIKLYCSLWEEKKEHSEMVLDRLNMNSYVDRPVHTYSLGMKQRLCFAMLLSANTPVMLMDEVMNGLDPDNVDLITSILMDLKSQGKLIFIASHLLDNLDLYADRILFIKDSELIILDESASSLFLKINTRHQSKKELKKMKLWIKGAELLPNGLLLLPLESYDAANEWVTQSLKLGFQEQAIGKLGAKEWYEKFYGQESESG